MATTELLIGLDLEEELRRHRCYSHWFDFTQNQSLRFENIIRATFENPERRDIPEQDGLEIYNRFALDEEYITADEVIRRMQREMPQACRKFDESENSTYVKKTH